MKQFKTCVLVLAVLLTASTATMANTNYLLRHHRNHKSGLRGTITSVGDHTFVLTLDTKKSSVSSSGATILNIVCDRNTKFTQGGIAVDPTQIKEGLTVSVVGSTLTPTSMQAMSITIEGSGKGKHKPKSSK